MARRSSSLAVAIAATLAPALLAVAQRPPGLADATCVACQAPLQALRETFTDAEWERLLEGKVVTGEVREDSKGKGERRTVTAAAILHAAPEQIWSVLTDWESYPSFMPNTKETRLRRLDGRRAWLSQHLEVFWADIRYGMVWTMEPEQGLARFAIDPNVPHDIAATLGSWRLAPLSAESTLVRFRFWIDTGMAVPGFVQRALTKRSLPKVIRGLRAEVARRLEESR